MMVLPAACGQGGVGTVSLGARAGCGMSSKGLLLLVFLHIYNE